MKQNDILIQEISSFLKITFNEINIWFDKNEDLRVYIPKNKGWNINQILEHIYLTNHFLLILIDKGTNKALASKLNLQEELDKFEFDKEKLDAIGIHNAFEWIRPEHMEPKGDKSLSEIKNLLYSQLNQCYSVLEKLKNGEGVLYLTTMTVNNLGKLNVYEYLYFLIQHCQRHLKQMEFVENEFETK